jgi:outer membrane protein OmpU
MKHTLLATTALVAIGGGASAELTVSMSARIGLKTTEGTAAVTTAADDSGVTANMTTTLQYLDGTYVAVTTGTAKAASAITTASANAVTASGMTELNGMIADAKSKLAASLSALGSTADKQLNTDIATMEAILAAARGTAASTAAAVADTTTGVNRVRVSFAGSGETDSGISYGASMRADGASAAATSGGGAHGSAHVSGAFGKVKMGDLGGADKDAAGHISGVGLTGLGDHNEITYQARFHNLGYEYSASGLTFGYSQDTSVQTGSNSAMGLKYSGDMGGATITVGIGQSKIGNAQQDTMSVAMSTGGLTLKAITSTNDNGPIVAATGAAQTSTVAYAPTVAINNTPDTDSTGLSISYAMDSVSVTAFTKTVSTLGSADMDYSGVGFSYDMGGVALKAGVVDNNDQQLVDFGLSFSF